MEKKAEVDGKWAEIEAKDISVNADAIDKCEILVINCSRIEMGGADKEAFAEKFARIMEQTLPETEGMDDDQRSYYVFRKMLIG